MNILKKGFTLIELIIVIAILGILAAGLLAILDPIEQINTEVSWEEWNQFLIRQSNCQMRILMIGCGDSIVISKMIL